MYKYWPFSFYLNFVFMAIKNKNGAKGKNKNCLHALTFPL